MFNLIITVISIALVAALALASIYYGGSALSQGSAKAAASTLVNQGQQINGAAALFSQDNGGAAVTATSQLTSGHYLSSVPNVPASAATGAWGVTSNNFTVGGVNSSVCKQVQKIATGATTIGASAASNQTFGCYANGTGTSAKDVFYYKQ